MINYFKIFKEYAFRLELLQAYAVKDEKESFKQFLDNRKISISKEDKFWYNIVKKAKLRKGKVQRVHVIKLPLSDYLRYELDAYRLNIKAGEDIFILNYEEFLKIKSNIKQDFWLFDDKIVLLMEYNEKGEFLGFKELKEDISKYIKLKNILLSKANPLTAKV